MMLSICMTKPLLNTTQRSIGTFSAARKRPSKFDAEVERAFTQIVQAPQRWAAGSYSTRRFLLRQFPFTLIYREQPSGVIQIVAVGHTSRKPGYWKYRL